MKNQTQKPSKEIQNLGPTSQAWLAKVGVYSLEDIQSVGAETVYQMLVIVGHPPNKNLLYALIGAEEGMDWKEVAVFMKKAERGEQE